MPSTGTPCTPHALLAYHHASGRQWVSVTSRVFSVERVSVMVVRE